MLNYFCKFKFMQIHVLSKRFKILQNVQEYNFKTMCLKHSGTNKANVTPSNGTYQWDNNKWDVNSYLNLQLYWIFSSFYWVWLFSASNENHMVLIWYSIYCNIVVVFALTKLICCPSVLGSLNLVMFWRTKSLIFKSSVDDHKSPSFLVWFCITLMFRNNCIFQTAALFERLC